MTIEEAKEVKQNSKVTDIRTGEEFMFISFNVDRVMVAIFPGMQVYWIEPKFLKLI